MSRMLNVYYRDRRVGCLIKEEYSPPSFYYETEWLKRGFPLSLSLPLRADDQGEQAFRFFVNLLPEGDARRRTVSKLKIADDDFTLLEYLGGECAGALVLSDSLQVTCEPSCEQMRSEKLDQLIATNGLSITSRQSGNDLSLAGAQDKLPVYSRGGANLPADSEFTLNAYHQIRCAQLQTCPSL